MKQVSTRSKANEYNHYNYLYYYFCSCSCVCSFKTRNLLIKLINSNASLEMKNQDFLSVYFGFKNFNTASIKKSNVSFRNENQAKQIIFISEIINNVFFALRFSYCRVFCFESFHNAPFISKGDTKGGAKCFK